MRKAVYVLAFVLLALAPATAQEPAPSPAKDLVVSLEFAQHFFYAGEPLRLRIAIRNTSENDHKNPVKTPLLDGFKVSSRGGTKLEPADAETLGEPTRPDTVAAQSFYGGVVDLSQVFPGLRKAGKYEIYWSGSGLVSQRVIVTVLPKYDPAKDYSGKITTDQGAIVVDLFEAAAPIAVKSFVDMANAGLYDGLQFHEVHADAFIVGGDPRMVDPPRTAIRYPAEPSKLPLVAGTVVMKPAGAVPPANGAEFIILLKPQPDWSGHVTVVGQVIDGLDVVQKISQVPSTMQNSRPNFKPVKDILIQKIEIRGRSKATGPATGAVVSPQGFDYSFAANRPGR